jgi:DNA-binding response OmpR family regulator
MTHAHVLVAEDNPRIAGMIATALRKEGYQVTVAYDGASALRLANNGGYDALLTDLRMPELGGDALAARARLAHSELPVLLMTASADIAQSEVPWAAVIRKPFRIAALLEALARTLGGAGADLPDVSDPP